MPTATPTSTTTATTTGEYGSLPVLLPLRAIRLFQRNFPFGLQFAVAILLQCKPDAIQTLNARGAHLDLSCSIPNAP